MKSKICGTELADDVKVCEACGAHQSAAQKNMDGNGVGLKLKIFACVKAALLLIAFFIPIIIVVIIAAKNGTIKNLIEINEYFNVSLFLVVEFIMDIILLIPTFFIFRGKKSEVLTVFEVLTSTISALWVGFVILAVWVLY